MKTSFFIYSVPNNIPTFQIFFYRLQSNDVCDMNAFLYICHCVIVVVDDDDSYWLCYNTSEYEYHDAILLQL